MRQAVRPQHRFGQNLCRVVYLQQQQQQSQQSKQGTKDGVTVFTYELL